MVQIILKQLICLCFDSDEAGNKSKRTCVATLHSIGMSKSISVIDDLPDGEDPDSFAKSHSAEGFTEFIETNEEDFITFKTRLLSKDVRNDPVKTKPFYDKARIMEDGVPVTIRPKFADKLKFEINGKTIVFSGDSPLANLFTSDSLTTETPTGNVVGVLADH